MPSTKEIRVKIKSVQNTRKITKAMEMVAASKMRSAQDRMRLSRPYAEKIRNITAHMAHGEPGIQAPVPGASRGQAARRADTGRHTDKGLCGGLNTNIQRLLLARMRQWESEGIRFQATAIGTKGLGFLQRLGAERRGPGRAAGRPPALEKLIGPVKPLLDAYAQGKIGSLYLAYSRFVNTMKQEPVIEQLLPLSAERLTQSEAERSAYAWDYIYEPDARSVVDELMVRYIEALVFQALAENMASEQSARMVAMKAASDNAKKMIEELQLVYNKTRQAGITKEISEIVGGSAAIA